MKSTYLICLVLLFATDCMAGVIKLPEEDAGYSLALLDEINLYRSERGLSRLHFDQNLARLARIHSTKMFQRQTMSHNNFDERFREANSRLCVENVGWNYSVPRQMFEGWQKSDGHNQNMLKEGIHRVGIAEIGKYVTFFACR